MSENKPPKPMPSPAEINAYLEQSAARTRMRLPLAKGNAVPMAPKEPGAEAAPAPREASRALPLQGGKKLPTKGVANAPAPPAPAGDGAWRPFSTDDDE